MSRFRLQFRRYRLPFRMPVRTAHGIWPEREGVIVRLDDAAEGAEPAAGFGEAAPIPWFGTETVDDVEQTLRGLGEWVEGVALDGVPTQLGCLRHALSTARRSVVSARRSEPAPAPAEKRPYLAIAALLPAGRAALGQILPKAEIGFRVFKWKVGVGDLADELSLLDDLCAALPDGAKLRLDANGAWDRRRAERWLERCAERPVEFVEQPCFADATQGETAQRRAEDVLLGLAGDYPTPIALDESVTGNADLERWLSAGWPGIFVVKPSLVADVNDALARLEKAKARVVFSAALETAVGARAALEAAFRWKGEVRAAGFGVWPLFQDPRFDGPAAAPFVRVEDVAAMDPEAVWNALS